MFSKVSHHLIVRELGTTWLPSVVAGGVDQTMVLVQLDEDELMTELETRLERRVEKFDDGKSSLRSAVIACNAVIDDPSTLATRYRIAKHVLTRLAKSGAGKLLFVVDGDVSQVVAMSKCLVREVPGAQLSCCVNPLAVAA